MFTPGGRLSVTDELLQHTHHISICPKFISLDIWSYFCSATIFHQFWLAFWFVNLEHSYTQKTILNHSFYYYNQVQIIVDIVNISFAGTVIVWELPDGGTSSKRPRTLLTHHTGNMAFEGVDEHINRYYMNRLSLMFHRKKLLRLTQKNI